MWEKGQLDYLLGRKEREAMRKNKLKQMEKQFEQHRKTKMSQMREKTKQSELNRTQSLMRQRTKTQQSMASFNEVSLKNKRN